MNWGSELLTVAASAALGWLASSLTKVSRKDFKELANKVEALKDDVADRITRSEFHASLDKLRSDLREDLADIKREIRSLRN